MHPDDGAGILRSGELRRVDVGSIRVGVVVAAFQKLARTMPFWLPICWWSIGAPIGLLCGGFEDL
jgi:hypothetical protein